MPFSGTGTGRPFDEYRVRSAYSGSLTFNHSFSEKETFLENEEQIEFLRKYTEEYLQLLPYFSADFYPLTQYCDKKDVFFENTCKTKTYSYTDLYRIENEGDIFELKSKIRMHEQE